MENYIERINKDTRAGFTYSIDDLFADVNEIYSEFDEGNEDYNQVVNALRVCCQTYLRDNEEKKICFKD